MYISGHVDNTTIENLIEKHFKIDIDRLKKESQKNKNKILKLRKDFIIEFLRVYKLKIYQKKFLEYNQVENIFTQLFIYFDKIGIRVRPVNMKTVYFYLIENINRVKRNEFFTICLEEAFEKLSPQEKAAPFERHLVAQLLEYIVDMGLENEHFLSFRRKYKIFLESKKLYHFSSTNGSPRQTESSNRQG